MKTSDSLKTLIPVALVLYLTLQKGGGFLLILLLPVFLIFAIYGAVRMIRRPDERKRRGIRIAVWGIAFALAGSVQTWRGAASRHAAEAALEKIQAYQGQTGRYPATLAEAGVDDVQLKQRWGVRYSAKGGEPSLAYPAPFLPLTTYEYDFGARRWRTNAY